MSQIDETTSVVSPRAEPKIYSPPHKDVKDMMEKKIPTLPTFPSDRQLDGKNYSTWVMQMEAVFESYDLAFMVL